MAKAAKKSTPVRDDVWIRTFYENATPPQRAVLREALEHVVAGGRVDEAYLTDLRARFGERSPQLLAAMRALERRQAPPPPGNEQCPRA